MEKVIYYPCVGFNDIADTGQIVVKGKPLPEIGDIVGYVGASGRNGIALYDGPFFNFEACDYGRIVCLEDGDAAHIDVATSMTIAGY